MQDTEKVKVVAKLNDYCAVQGSQKKAAQTLKGISEGTISQMLNGNWEHIADEMWTKLSKSIGYDPKNWVIVNTEAYNLAYSTLTDIQDESLSKGIVAEAGTGKTQAFKNFCYSNRDAFRLKCSEYWNRKTFVEEMVKAMHFQASGRTVNQLMYYIVEAFKTRPNPIVIFDETDKLNDQTLHFYITLFNELEEHVGFALCGTPNLETRIIRGADRGRKGYSEILSRIGGEFIRLPKPSPIEVASICKANGVDDAKIIQEIAQISMGDIRVVKDRVYAYRREMRRMNNGK